MVDKVLERAILVIIALMLLFVTWTDRAQFLRVLELQEKALIAATANAEQRACEVLYLEKELRQFYIKKGKGGDKN